MELFGEIDTKAFDKLIRKINREFLALSKKHGRLLATNALKKYFKSNVTLGDCTVNEILDLLVTKKLRRVLSLLETGHFEKLGKIHIFHVRFVWDMMNDYILDAIQTYKTHGIITVIDNEEELILPC